MNERCILNPHQFVPELPELDLDSLGLAVRAEGVDWGEASITPQMVKAAQGESSAAGHRDGVPIKIPIRVKEEGNTSLAEAAFALEAIVAGWQDDGGWILRDYDDDLGFAGPLGYRVIRHTANLDGLQGWLMAHNRDAPDVTLTATRWPIGYSPEEYKSAVWVGESEVEIPLDVNPFPGNELGGTAPGHIRYLVDNLNETEHLRGIILAGEWRDHPQDDTLYTTAALSYEAVDLSRRGAAKAATVEGLDVIEHTALTSEWLTVLGSKITDHGHMTHAGARRLWIRSEDLGSKAGDVEYHVRWRTLGGLNWDDSNPAVPSPFVDSWALLDLGECRPQPPVIGDPRWEWELQARSPSGSGGCRIHKVWPFPTETFVVLRGATASIAPDQISQRNPGRVQSKPRAGETLTWTNISSAKTSNDSWATVTL